MLVELAVTNLGVISELTLRLGPGMTALTGETGTGKTLVVGAIELLVGSRAEATVVRPGATEARVEGRFVTPAGDEVVLARAVPAEGRSRAYVDGRLAPLSALAELGAGLVDLHGQHGHQALLAPAEQRAALDRFGDVDTSALSAARRRLGELEKATGALGGDARARAREAEVLRFQVDEIEGAGLGDVDEEARLAAEEATLADAVGHRQAAARAHDALLDEGGAGDAVAGALAVLGGRPPFAELEARLRSVSAEVAEAGADIRRVGETIDTDPARLESVQARRQLLSELRRKYGAGLGEVIGYGRQVRARLEALAVDEARAAGLDAERAAWRDELRRAAAVVGARRREAAPALARAVEGHLRELAMPAARVEVVVGPTDPGDEVAFLLGANPGEGVLALAKAASGGELARAMLALRLVLLAARPDEVPPPRANPGEASTLEGRTLVFDEVDAGVGGTAALAVGRSLSALAGQAQVLVVTHLPQVAAFADAQVAVTKHDEGGRTVARACTLDEAERVVELSRMLSGQPESMRARGHAEELLSVAARARRR